MRKLVDVDRRSYTSGVSYHPAQAMRNDDLSSCSVDGHWEASTPVP